MNRWQSSISSNFQAHLFRFRGGANDCAELTTDRGTRLGVNATTFAVPPLQKETSSQIFPLHHFFLSILLIIIPYLLVERKPREA